MAGVIRFHTGSCHLPNSANKPGVAVDVRRAWYAHWVGLGFKTLEAMRQQSSGRYCHGDTPTLADCCLVPQLYNAERFHVLPKNYLSGPFFNYITSAHLNMGKFPIYH